MDGCISVINKITSMCSAHICKSANEFLVFSSTRFNLPHSNIVRVYIASFKNISFAIYLFFTSCTEYSNMVEFIFASNKCTIYRGICTSLSRNKFFCIEIRFLNKIYYMFIIYLLYFFRGTLLLRSYILIIND